MIRLINYFIEKSMLVNLLSIVVLVVGLLSVFSLQKETFPQVDFETITIRANYRGASAEDVEKLVTIPYERELKEVDGIEEMNALSGEGYAIIIIKVDPDFTTDEVLEDVRTAVDNVLDLPEDVDRPNITKLVNTLRPIIKVAITGEDEWELRREAKKLRDRIERVNGIAKVRLDGYREEIIEIAVNPNKLEKYELTLSEVVRAVRDRNTNISGGTVKDPKRELIVRTLTEYENNDEIERVVVQSNASGSNVKVIDLAKVRKSLKEESVLTRANGKLAVILDVVAKSRADVIKTTESVKVLAKKYFEENKQLKMGYVFFDELAFYVKRRLGILTQNGLQGMVLVFLCLVAFMNFRVSFVTSLGAPLAFLVAFALMDYFGISINLISMFGMILVLGMLVDDSIIVSENFYQYIEKGMDPEEAARISAKETLAPVSATILTTMVAFGTLFFMGGIMGKFLWPVPAVVIICLVASWFECFFFLPSHLKDFVKVQKEGMEKTRWYQPLYNSYIYTLKIALKHYGKTIIAFLLIFFVSIGTLFTMNFELFPGDDVQILFIKLKGKVGTPRDETNLAIQKVEQVVLKNLKKDELESVTSVVGSQRSNQGFTRVGSHYGMVTIYITMQDFRERSTEKIIKDLTDKSLALNLPFEISVDKRTGGPPKGKPVNVELSGETIAELKTYSKKIEEVVSKQKGVLASEIDYEEGKEQVIIKIKEGEARRLGLSNTQIAMEIRRAYEGEVATEIKKSDEDIDVIVRYDDETRSSIDILNNLYILNQMGRRIKLSHVSTFVRQPGSFIIRRKDRKRTFSISAEINKLKANALNINKTIDPIIRKLISDNPNLDYELTGENKDTAESLQNFKKAAIISMFLIFIILVAMFGSLVQPLIIMSAIPLGMIGVIFTFKIFSMPISFMALMGIIGLVGVVVNDSIVLVNFINIQLKKNEDTDIKSVLKASISRFRPVILTTFTTVVGLLPIAHMPGGDPFLKPMAISFAYGLMFSTTLTLVFVPCCSLWHQRVVQWWDQRKAQA